MNHNPNETRPELTTYKNFSLELGYRLQHVCYQPTAFHILKEMALQTNWQNRFYQRGRDFLVMQTHFDGGTISGYVQDYVRDGILTELIPKSEVINQKHRQNFRFNLPNSIILNCSEWFPHASNGHHNFKRAEKWKYREKPVDIKHSIGLAPPPAWTPYWEDDDPVNIPF